MRVCYCRCYTSNFDFVFLSFQFFHVYRLLLQMHKKIRELPLCLRWRTAIEGNSVFMHACVRLSARLCVSMCVFEIRLNHMTDFIPFSLTFFFRKRIKMPNLYLPHKQAIKQQQQQQKYRKMQCQCFNIDHDYDGTLQIQTIHARTLNERSSKKKNVKRKERISLELN